MRTDRFLDPPEFQATHDTGNQMSVFDRVDAKVGSQGTFHLNLQAARSSFDVPNSLDAAAVGQAQHQQIDTFNVAPGLSQVIGSKTLFTANAYVRQDHLTYTPSPDPFADQPGTVSQNRKLTNLGIKADLAYSTGNHNRQDWSHGQRDEAGRTLHASGSPTRRSTRRAWIPTATRPATPR